MFKTNLLQKILTKNKFRIYLKTIKKEQSKKKNLRKKQMIKTLIKS